MSDMRHTPGPWEVDASKASKGVIYVFTGRTDLAVMLGHQNPSTDAMIADARLMAAAPELLEACRLAIKLLEGYVGIEEEVRFQLDEAIASALLPVDEE